MDARLSARAALWRQYCRLHDLVVKMVAHSEPYRRFMAIPGAGSRRSATRTCGVRSIRPRPG
jgi:transposase